MSTRAEEVAEMIVQGWLKTEPNALNVKRMIATILSSLPEFQPGRELTVDDVKRIWETIGPVSHTEWYVRMAVELNKIRASKAEYNSQWAEREAHLLNAVEEREKERDELTAKLEAAEKLATQMKSESQHYRDLWQKTESQPCVGVTKEQVRDAWNKANETIYVASPVLDHCDLIAAALSPKWIKCSERMPALGASIWICRNDVQNFPRDVGVAVLCLSEDREPDHFFETFDGICEVADVSDWLPRPIPAPPVQEDSELVKELSSLKCPLCTESCEWTVKKAIEIVKKWEGKR